MDENGVLTNIAPVEQPPSTTEAPASTTPEAPLTRAEVAKLVATEAARLANEAKETGRRELQSQQDRNRAEKEAVARRAQEAETTLSAVRGRLTELDPDTAKELELAELRAKAQVRVRQEQEDADRSQKQSFHDSFRSRQVQYIKTLGLDPEDKNIDWGDDAPNYLDAMTRTLDSVAKLQTAKVNATQSELQKKLSTLETALKQLNVDINSVPTTVGQAPAADSDANFLKKFAASDIPLTKENMARYNKIMSTR